MRGPAAKDPDISPKEFLKTFREDYAYDPETGIFTHTRDRKRAAKGEPAGSPLNGYIRITHLGFRVFAHRLAWLWIHERWPVGQVDHKDRCYSHNWISNLREATPTINKQNIIKARCDSKTGIQGVKQQGNRYVSTITVDGERIYLGCFHEIDEAKSVRVQAKLKYHSI